MTSVFISHAQTDLDAALRIASQLTDKGVAWLLLDTQAQSTAVEWERELIRCLQSSRFVVALVSEAYVRSCQCFAELNLARFLGKPIIALRVSSSVNHPLLTETRYIDLCDGEAQALETMWTELKNRTGGLNVETWTRPPYPGLKEFREEDAPVFFGRENEVQQTVEFLQFSRRLETGRLIILVGPSGCGKSSLIRAGVIPFLQNSDRAWQVMRPIVIDEQPLQALSTSLVEAFKHPPCWSVKEVVNQLRSSDAANRLNELARVILQDAEVPDGVLLLIFDRLEALFLDVGAHEAEIFAKLLKGALETPGSRIIAVAALRADYWSDFQNHSTLSSIRNRLLSVGPLSENKLRDVVLGPARVAGLEIESSLVEILIRDAYGANSLPLLAFALRELWESSRIHGRFVLADYLDCGGGASLLNRLAEAAYARVPLSESNGDPLRAAFLPLVTVHAHGGVHRRRALIEDIPVSGRVLVEAFIQARLLVASDENGRKVVEVTTEALLHTWSRLRALIEEARQDLALRTALSEAAGEWDARNRDPIYLWPKGRGEMVAEAVARLPDFLNEVERAFLERVCEEVKATGSVFVSYARADRERARQLAMAIEQEGWQVWWDLRIQPGEDFDKAIEAALHESACVLVLWSERAVSSLYVKGEAREALAQNKLVPVFIEDVKPPYDLRSIQGVYLREWAGERDNPSYQQIVDRLKSYIPRLA